MIFFLFNFYLINSLLSLLEKNYYVFYRLLNTKIIFNSIFKKITTTLYNYVNPFGGQSQHAVSSRFTYRGAKKKKKKKHVESAVPRAEDQRHSHCKFPFVRRLNTEQRTLKIFLDASRPSMRFVRFRMR